MVSRGLVALIAAAYSAVGTHGRLCRIESTPVLVSTTSGAKETSTDVSTDVGPSDSVSVSSIPQPISTTASSASISVSDPSPSTSLSDFSTTTIAIEASPTIIASSFTDSSSQSSGQTDSPSPQLTDASSTTISNEPIQASTSTIVESSPTPEPVILRDGDFEEPTLDSWGGPSNIAGTARLQASSPDVCSSREGSGQYLFCPGTGGVGAYLTQELNVIQGHTYRLKYWYTLGQSQNFAPNGQKRCRIGANVGRYATETVITASTPCQWTAGVELTFVPNNPQTYLYMPVYCTPQDSVDILLDDITIVDTGLPPVPFTPDPTDD